MGPLIPDIISSEWNNIAAIVIGLAFGFVLESAGFSSSRKLVGVFYGYDFAVLRVFFTAAITASIGLLFMDYFGWINMADLYVYPARIWPIIVGGLFMGLGFVTGGFCPGTCVTAIGIGKMDGLVFFIGIMIGVLVFSELFPLYADFYNSSNLGNVTIPEYFNISPYWFMAIISVIAIMAFYVTVIIRKRVKKVEY
jgi:uncharacterized membrane protein YedE/YeeE